MPEAASDLRISTDGGSHYFWVNSNVLLLLSDSPEFSSEENNLFGLLSSCCCWVKRTDFKRQAETWKDINNNLWWVGYDDEISRIIWNRLVGSKTTYSDRGDEDWYDLKSGFYFFWKKFQDWDCSSWGVKNKGEWVCKYVNQDKEVVQVYTISKTLLMI